MSDFLATSSETDEEPLEVLEWDDDAALDPSDEQERTRRRQRSRQRTMLWIAVAVVVLSFLLQVKGETRVAFWGLENLPLPELCGSRAMFNVECPGCGLTRSILSLARGDWERSLEFHRIGWVMALVIVLQIPYRIYRLHELKTRIPDAKWPLWFGNGLIALLLINWLYNCFV